MKIILHWLIISGAVYALGYFLPDISVNPWWVALIVGAVLYVFHSLVKPVVKILTLPINLLTLGLFSLVLNGAVFYVLSLFIQGFNVSTFIAAFLGALAISVVNWILSKLF